MEGISSEETIQNQRMAVYQFDQADLAANRVGRLSLAQKKRIARSGWRPLLIFASAGYLFAALVVLAARKPLGEIDWSMPSLLLILATLLGLAMASAHWRTCQAGTVTHLHGMVEYRTLRTKVYLDIAGTSIPMLGNGPLLFQNGAPYDIYYAPLILTILSAEKSTVNTRESMATPDVPS